VSPRPTGERSPRDGTSGRSAGPSRAPGQGREASPSARRDAPGLGLGASRQALPPDPQVPHWREPDGARQSYQTLRCGLEPGAARELGQAHIGAIEAIASAALAAAERGERREARRLAAAAGRLCGEIAGRWPPTAVEIPRHRAEAEP
jgi:hypothetical protein